MVGIGSRQAGASYNRLVVVVEEEKSVDYSMYLILNL